MKQFYELPRTIKMLTRGQNIFTCQIELMLRFRKYTKSKELQKLPTTNQTPFYNSKYPDDIKARVPETDTVQRVPETDTVQRVPETDTVQRVPETDTVQRVPETDTVQRVPETDTVQRVPESGSKYKQIKSPMNLSIIFLFKTSEP